MRKKIFISSLSILLATLLLSSCKSTNVRTVEDPLEVIVTNEYGKGPSFEITVMRGATHNHPLMVVWLEDTTGAYLQTLYVAKSIATGVFGHGDKSKGVWQPGPIRRPAALPYWSHKRGVKEADGLYMPTPQNPIPDAYSGATPQAGFILKSNADDKLPDYFDILLEINQPWDWNEYWTNNKFPDDDNYKTSSQPSLIYHARMSSADRGVSVPMTIIGRGHHSGKDGKLYTDLETMTTALNILDSVKVEIRP